MSRVPRQEPVKSWHLQQYAYGLGLSKRDLAVFQAIAFHFNEGRQDAYAGQGKLAALTGYSKRTVGEALKSLEQLGHIVREPRWLKGQNPPKRDTDLILPVLPAGIATRAEEEINPADAWLPADWQGPTESTHRTGEEAARFYGNPPQASYTQSEPPLHARIATEPSFPSSLERKGGNPGYVAAIATRESDGGRAFYEAMLAHGPEQRRESAAEALARLDDHDACAAEIDRAADRLGVPA